MQRWEYARVYPYSRSESIKSIRVDYFLRTGMTIEELPITNKSLGDDLENKIAELGFLGWELVSVTSDSTMFYFKRPKP